MRTIYGPAQAEKRAYHEAEEDPVGCGLGLGRRHRRSVRHRPRRVERGLGRHRATDRKEKLGKILLISVVTGVAVTAALETWLQLAGDEPSSPKDLAAMSGYLAGVVAVPLVGFAVIKRLLG